MGQVNSFDKVQRALYNPVGIEDRVSVVLVSCKVRLGNLMVRRGLVGLA